jgi:beta-mannanase
MTSVSRRGNERVPPTYTGAVRTLLIVTIVAAGTAIPASATSVATATATRLAAPPDGQAYFGLTFRLFDTGDPAWGDTRSLDERIADTIRNELGGKTPAFIKVWTPWQHPDLARKPLVPFSEAAGDIAKVQKIVGDGGVLHLDWNITSTTAANGGITSDDVRAGKLDRYIRAYARDVKAYGKPILLTLFNGEFNGSWWYGVSPKANRRLTTEDFVQAWRRVVDIFRAVGVGNASFAWVVNSYPNDAVGQPGIDRDIGAYWPGNDYVDWVGADVYDVGAPDWLDGPYAFAVAHGKPVFIGEFGIRHEWSSVPPAQWATWLSGMFDYFETHPAIKAISYFNLNNRIAATRVRWDPARSIYLDGGRVNYVPDVNDHDHRLLAGGAAIQALFSRRIASPRYVSTISTTTVQTQPQTATVALLPPTATAKIVTVRWQANLASDTFDVQLKRGRADWFNVRTRSAAKTFRIRRSRSLLATVRVRALDVYGDPGPWSAGQRIPFP